VSAYGTVAYVVNGQTRSAAFDRRTGNTARYLDTIPAAQVATNGIYSVSSASVTVTYAAGTLTLSLNNPGSFIARCGGPSNAPGGGNSGSGGNSGDTQPTAQPASPTPTQQVPDQVAQLCADGAPEGEVGPNVNATIVNCPWIVIVTGDDSPTQGRIGIRALAPNNLPPPNSGDSFSGPLANIVFIDASGNLVAHPTFANPIEICYAYAAADLARVGNNPAGLAMQFYDEGSATWITLPTAPNSAAGRICATVNHLTKYAVAIHQQVPASLPNTGADDAQLGVWIWSAIVLTLLAGATLLLLARRPARQ